jgi:ankyrin repeat protein/Mg-chelatase subunit ChlD
MIIKEMPDVNEQDQNGRTALHTAAQYSSQKMVNLLLNHGANSKIVDMEGYAPIHIASRLGNLPAVMALVAHDPSNADLKDNTDLHAPPLHHAAEENQTSVIEFLNLKCKTDINSANAIGESAAFVAATCDNPETIATLSKLGGNLTLRSELDEAAMDIAAREGSTRTIVAIAQKAPKAVSAEDEEGNQPLSQCYVGETVDILTKLGADPRHTNEEGQTALHTTATDHNRLGASRMLLLCGSDVDAKDSSGQTALHVAASANGEETVDMLLDEGGANVDERDNLGRTPLLLALDRQFLNISEKILDKGADFRASDRKGLTALHYTARNGYSELSKKLVDMGAVINSPDITGKTPLHYAVISDPRLAKMLVNMGANMYARDARGDTPLGLSVKQGHPLKRLTDEEFQVLKFTETSKEELVIPPGPTCPSKCFADGPGLKGCHVNTRYSFSIFTCDKTGKLRTEGGDALTVDILSSTRRRIRVNVGEKRDQRLTVSDGRNGVYAVAYQLEDAGLHDFHILIAGEPIYKSPYRIQLAGYSAPPPTIISSTQYSQEKYEESTIQFAMESGIGQVDIAIVCDTTSSMGREINAVQRLMQDLVDAVKSQDLCKDLRIALIAYRDHEPQDSTYVTRVWPFTSDIPSVKRAINSLSALGGGDVPEAVADALHQLLQLNWDEASRPHAVRMAVLIGDAPPHGMIGHGMHYRDGFPYGCPCGHDWLILAEQCHSKRINVYTVMCRCTSPLTDQAFSAIAESSGGKCTRITSENNFDIINLIKLHVQVQLDEHLTYSTVSDVIVKKPLDDGSFEKHMASVSKALVASGFKVRRLQTDRNIAAIRIRSICADDVYESIENFKICERLVNTTGDLVLMDHMGKKLYALKKVEGHLPSNT